MIQKLRRENFVYRDDIVNGLQVSNDYCTIRVIAPNAESRNVVAEKVATLLNNTADDTLLPTIKELAQNKWTMKKNTPENKASIAFELETWSGAKFLMLGDAEYGDYVDGLNVVHKNIDECLEYGLVKLSHHGSKNNFHPDLLGAVHAKFYVVSTNGKKYGHPDKDVLAQIVAKSDSSILFNYEERMKVMFCEQDFIDYPDLQDRIEATESLWI